MADNEIIKHKKSGIMSQQEELYLDESIIFADALKNLPPIFADSLNSKRTKTL